MSGERVRRRGAVICGLVGTGLSTSTASAQTRWVGEWFSVPAASRPSAHTFTLSALPGGGLRYDSGRQRLVLSPGGEAVREPFQPNASVSTQELTPTSLRFEELSEGRPTLRVEEHLSPDGRRLVGRRTRIDADGRERGREVNAMRVGQGHGLPGAWREPPAQRTGAAAQQGSVQPFWIIQQGADGATIWTLPQTGEVLSGPADGRPHPVGGASALAGRTFTLRALSSRHLQWCFYENGQLIERADERLSANGKLWTDLVWTPIHPEEKDRFVYRRG